MSTSGGGSGCRPNDRRSSGERWSARRRSTWPRRRPRSKPETVSWRRAFVVRNPLTTYTTRTYWPTPSSRAPIAGRAEKSRTLSDRSRQLTRVGMRAHPARSASSSDRGPRTSCFNLGFLAPPPATESANDRPRAVRKRTPPHQNVENASARGDRSSEIGLNALSHPKTSWHEMCRTNATKENHPCCKRPANRSKNQT